LPGCEIEENMPSDAHCHPYYLKDFFSDYEQERRILNIQCAASAFSGVEFLHNEELAKKNDAPYLALCFGFHPQMPAYNLVPDFELFEALVREKRIVCIGESGFDFFDKIFTATEALQQILFEEQLNIAKQFTMPMLLHIRRAMHKIFVYRKKLRSLPAVVFHSFSGSVEEAKAILRCGINAYFSFGTPLLCNHKKALRCVIELPLERLLFETDAPYQKLNGASFTSFKELNKVMEKAACLREESSELLINITDANFNNIFRGK
jgi:TatD DNase family protein